MALKTKGLAVSVANAGVSGDTASGGLGRLDWSVPEGTDAAIVELGANDMLRALGRNGGVCMINFFSAFVNDSVAEVIMRAQKRTNNPAGGGGTEEMPSDATDWDQFLTWYSALGSPTAKFDDVIDHILHAAQVAGMLDDHFAGRANRSQWILMLLTFEIWHRLFIDQRPAFARPAPAAVLV